MCYPFQVAGTHDALPSPRLLQAMGMPTADMHRENAFYDAGDGLILFRGEEPWQRIDIYGQGLLRGDQGVGSGPHGFRGRLQRPRSRRRWSGTSTACSASPEMREELEKLGIGFSNYGSERRAGPTIGMALVTMAHYPSSWVWRWYEWAPWPPCIPFLTRGNEQVGIQRDHRAFYDIMRRLKVLCSGLTHRPRRTGVAWERSESRNLQETSRPHWSLGP